MKNKFTKKHKHVLIIKGTQGMAKLSLAVVLSGFRYLKSSTSCARALSFFGVSSHVTNQSYVDSTSCARALSQLRTGFGVALRHRASSTSCARALSLLGVFIISASLFMGTLSLSGRPATAATSNTLNFQGRLLSNTGALVPDGNYHMEFKLYYVSAAGTAQWTETRSTGNLVSVQNGYYSIYLGDVTVFPGGIDWSQDLYLGMNIGGSGGSASWDGEMTPRFKLTSVPYAFRAANVASSSTNAALSNSDDVTITSGNALGATSNSGDISIDVGTATGTTGTISLGAANASSVLVGSAGVDTNVKGTLTVDEQITANGNLTISGGTDFGVYYRDASDNLVTTAAGASGECFRGTTGAAPVWGTCAGTGDIVQNGNSFAAAMRIGTNDAYDLQLEVADTVALTIDDATLSVTLVGDLAVNGDDITSDGDLTITPAGGDLTLGANTLVTGAISGVALTVNNTTSVGNILNLQDNGTNVVTVADGGAVVLQNTTNSTSALSVQNAAGTDTIFNVDTINNRVGIGTSTPSATLEVVPIEAVLSSNLVTNGTFTGSATGWTLESSCSVYGTNNVVVTYDLACQGDADYPAVSTTFSTTSGSYYRVAFTLSDVAGEDVYVSLDGSVYSGTFIGDDTYTFEFLSSFTGTEIIYFESSNYNTDGTWTIDDVSIVEISAPSVYTLSVQTGGSYLGGVLEVVGAANLLNNLTVSGITTLQDDLTVVGNAVIDAGSSLTVTGGNTASRPASPTEGMIYFDTDTSQLITYSNGKWQADRSESIIVAASTSTQQQQDVSDYVADGTSDQTEINSALTGAAGGKVYLMPGTYYIDGTILIPNDTTLSGAGRDDTIIEFAGVDVSDNMIEATGVTRTGQSVRDLTLNGRQDLSTTGFVNGVFLASVDNAVVDNVVAKNLRYNGFMIQGNSLKINNTVSENNGSAFIFGDGYYIFAGDDMVITNNIARDSTGEQEYGFRLDGINNSIFTGNITEGNIARGFDIAGSTNVLISQNTAINNETGFAIGSAESIIDSNVSSGNSTAGFYVSANNNVISNNLAKNNGGATDNNGIFVESADNNIITGNRIIDSSCTTTCYAINISNAGSDKNYLSANRYSGSAANAASINDSGTNTIYEGQQTNSTTSTNSDVSDIRFRGSANSTSAFSVQNASGASILNVDTTNGEVELGNSSTAGKLVVSDGSSNTGTILVQATSGDYTYTIPTTTANDTFCLVTLANCIGTSDIVQNGNSFGTAITIGTNDTFDLNFETNGTTRITVDDTTGNVNFTGSVVLAASQSLTVTGGNTASRPGSPTEGMVYFDSTTKQLLTYANGKWQADRSTATKIVAASNSSQAIKDSADYVADGTDDQVEINAALTAAAGGRVYLTEGTFVTHQTNNGNATILVPDNTTLSGTGRSTLIEFGNFDATDNLIENSNTSSAVGVVIRDLRLSGREDLNTAGTQNGIFLTYATGTQINGVEALNFRNTGILASYTTGTQYTNNVAKDNDTGFQNSLFALDDVFSNNLAQSNTNCGFAIGHQALLTGNKAISNTDGFCSSGENTFTGNSANSNSATGFSVSQGSNIVFNGNVAQSNATGFKLDQAAYVALDGNTALNNATGILLTTYTAKSTVSNNTISSNTSIGISLSNSDNNIITGNSIYNSGGATSNNGIDLSGSLSGSNSITSNIITDTSCTTTCYAINIQAGDKNYLSANRYSGSAANAASINDSGTNTIYEGQQTNSTTSTNSDVSDIRFRGSANSTSAFSVQNASGASILNVDTTNGEVELGNSSTAGKLVVSDGSSNTATLVFASSSADVTFQLPAASAGTYDICTTASVCSGYASSSTAFIQDGNSFAATATLGTNDANSLVLETNNQSALTIASGGATTLQNATNSTNALRVNNAAGTQVFGVDTTNLVVKTETLEAISVGTVADHTVTTIAATASVSSSTFLNGSDLGRFLYTTSVYNYVECTNASCSTRNTTALASNIASPTMTIGSDGRGRIVFTDTNDNYTKLLRCTNDSCSTSTITTIETSATYGTTDPYMGNDGFPRILYTDMTTNDLVYVQCNDADCTAPTKTTIDTGTGASTNAKIVKGNDGFARIAYRLDDGGTDIQFVQCTNASCSTNNNTVIDSSSQYVEDIEISASDNFARLMIASDDFEFVQTGTAEFVRCTNASCSTNVQTALDLNKAGKFVLGSDGFARMISYTVPMRYSKCNDTDCSSITSDVFDAAAPSYSPSLVLGSDDFVRIAYTDYSTTGTNTAMFAQLTADQGLAVVTGSSVGTDTARYGTAYLRGIDLQGGLTINNSGRRTAAVEISGGGEYLNFSNSSGIQNLSVSDLALKYTAGQENFSSYSKLRVELDAALIATQGGTSYSGLTTSLYGATLAAYNGTGSGTLGISSSGAITLDSGDGVNSTGLSLSDAGGFTVSASDGVNTGELQVSPNYVTVLTGTLKVINLGSADTSTYLCRNSTNEVATCSSTPLTSSLTDNIADSLDIQEGTNNYININTTNSSENISFGNATTNPSFNLLGSGRLTVGSSLTNLGAKLAVVGTSDEEQLLIRANATQSLTNPLIVLQNSAGTELARINVDAGGNIAFGSTTLDSISTGTSNIGIGAATLTNLSAGSNNIAIGDTSQQSGTGSQNISLGVGTLSGALFSGSWNTAIGDVALQDNETGVENTAVGRASLGNNTDGSQNTAVGNGALNGNLTGNQNTAVGNGAGTLSTGGQNVFVGYNAGDNLTSGGSNIIIGSGIDAVSSTGSSQLNIGDSLYGDLSNDRIAVGTSTTSAARLTVDNAASTDAIFVANDNGVAVLTIADGGAVTLTNNLTVQGNTTLGNATTDRLTITSYLLGQNALIFEGATDGNGFATTLAVTDPTANNTITLPDASGTVLLAPSGSGNGLVQVPTSNSAGVAGANIISPTAASIVGLTVNGTTSTAATALAVAQTGAASAVTVSQSAAANGLVITSSNASQVSSTALSVTQSGTTTGFTGNFINFVGSSTTGAGNLLNLTSVNTTAGNALNVTANGLTTGDAVDINHSTAVMTSGALLRLSSTAVDAFTTGGLAVISSSTNFTSTANTAGLLNVSATASAAGTLVNIANSFASQTTSTALNVVQTGTTTGFTGNFINFVGSSTTGAGNLLNLTSVNTTAGNALNVTANALTTGDAVNINSTGTGLTTGSLLRLSTATTGAVATDGVVSLNATGNYTSTSNIGLLSVLANTTQAGTIQNIQGNALTTGNGLRISSTGTGLTTGSLFYGTTATTGAVATNGVFSLNATGNYTSTSNVGLLNVAANATTAGTITNIQGNALTTGTALNVTSTGVLTTTGNIATFTANAATTATGVVAINATGLTTGAALNVTSNSTAIAIQSNGNIAFGELTGTRTLGVQTRTTNVPGTALTVQSGQGGSTSIGGALTLQGGSGGSTSGNGGNVMLVGGTATSGTKGLVVADTFALSTASLQTTGTAITAITQANIDSFGAVLLSASTTGVTYTLGDPTLGASATGRIIYITNAGATNDFVLSANGGTETINLKPNTTATMIWNGSDWTAAGASSATDLQAAYDNTAATAGGAEIVLRSTLDSPTGTGGLTIRNNETVPIVGGLLEVQSSIGSNLFAVNNNSTEYANNGGAENSTFTMWTTAPTAGGSVAQHTTLGDNIATGAGSVFVNGAATANSGARNTLSSTLTRNLKYRVSFAVRHTSSSTAYNTLDVRYSPTGSATDQEDCSTANTVNYGQWTRITCTFVYDNVSTPTSSNAILLTHSDAVDHDYYIDNLSVTVSADVNHAIDGSVDAALGTNWQAIGGSVARSTSVLYDTSGSVAATTSGTAGRGVYNNLTSGIIPQISTQYRVAFYARGDGTNTATLAVAYTPDNNSTSVSCSDYSTQVAAASAYTLVTCLLTTSATTPITSQQLRITQTAGTATVFYVDALTMTLNNNNSNNVQIGGANKGGPVTLFTLDRSSGAPIAANNDAYLGSMYYDTASGRIQCYEADGWGACGAAPDNYVNLNPEYAGAVLHGDGVGTMTADFCSNQSGVLQVNYAASTDPCYTSGDVKNYYKWTSPQSTPQTYSIYVTYQLPATFNGFSSDDTVQLQGRVSDTATAEVSYEMFAKTTAGSLSQCYSGSAETTVAGAGAGSANLWYTVGINGNEATGCGLTSSYANGQIIFKINMKANSNASAYVSTLSFTTTGR